MMEANMRLARIGHHAQAVALLDYADRHGFLLVEEAANWQLSETDMQDPEICRLWEQQMREMLERDWNHPSIIAWSVGNEYDSQTAGGIQWTRDAMKFTRSLDNTRLLTFASNKDARPQVKGPQDEASFLCDFISLNIYGNYTGRLDHAHWLWPDKPIFVSEFGRSGETGLDDPKRAALLTSAFEAMKARPYVMGGGIWAFSDYRSRYPGTPPSGYRVWGIVTPNRERRASFGAVKRVFEGTIAKQRK
jgi:beta-glucuronidase